MFGLSLWSRRICLWKPFVARWRAPDNTLRLATSRFPFLTTRLNFAFIPLHGLKHPVEDCFHLKRFQIRPERKDASSNAAQVGSRPTGCRLVREGAEIAPAMCLKLDLFAQLVS